MDNHDFPNDRDGSSKDDPSRDLPINRLGLDSRRLAQFIEAKDGLSKPWMLVLLRLAMLQERKDTLSPETYMRELTELHQEMMGLGEWWVGLEDEVFNP